MIIQIVIIFFVWLFCINIFYFQFAFFIKSSYISNLIYFRGLFQLNLINVVCKLKSFILKKNFFIVVRKSVH